MSERQQHMEWMITRAMQIAIQERADKRTVDDAILECRNQLWREYEPDEQDAVERAVRGFYGIKPRSIPKPFEVIKGKPKFVKVRKSKRRAIAA